MFAKIVLILAYTSQTLFVGVLYQQSFLRSVADAFVLPYFKTRQYVGSPGGRFMNTPNAYFEKKKCWNWQSRSALFAGKRASGGWALPTLQQVRTDPFMAQVQHAHSIVTAMIEIETSREVANRSEEGLIELISDMLSHSDGIRGFFVTYLTMDLESEFVVPKILLLSMKDSNLDEIIPLACMNVVMPTAMMSIHTDPALSQSSARTASRGMAVLASLREHAPVDKNCKAIIQAASTTAEYELTADQGLVEYWKKFMKNYGYEKKQLQDIVSSISTVVEKR